MTDNRVHHAEDPVPKISLREVLKSLVLESATQASMHSSLSIAKAEHDHYQAEYDSVEYQFSKYPCMKERATKRRDDAKKEVDKLELQLKNKETAQESIVVGLEQAIFNVQQLASSSETVSRKDFETLQRSHDTLQDRFDKQQDRCDSQQEDIDKLKESLKALTKEVSEAQHLQDESSRKLQAIDNHTTALQKRTTINENSIELVKKDSQTKVDHLRKALQPKIDTLDSKTASNAKAIEGLNTVCENQKSATSELTNGLAKNKTEAIAHGETVRQLGQKVDGFSASVEVAEELAAKREQELERVWSEITEPGKESVAKRLKRQDQAINNLSTKMQSISAPEVPKVTGPTLAQFSQLEHKVTDLDKDVQDSKEALVEVRKRSDIGADTGTTLLSESAKAEFASREFVNDGMDVLRREIGEESDDRDGIIAKKLDSQSEESREGLRALSNKFEEFVEVQKQELIQLREKTTDAQAWANTQIGSMAKTLESLQTQQTTLSESIHALQKRSPASVVNSPAAAPSTQFRPASLPDTHTLTNGVSSPSNANWAARPNGSAVNSRPSPMTPGAGPTNHELVGMLNGMSAHVQHLKQRMDNLTTDELSQQMTEQWSRMFQAKIDALQKDISTLRGRCHPLEAAVNTLQTTNNAFGGRLHSLEQFSHALRADLDHFKTQMPKNNADTETLQKSVQGIETQTKAAIESAKAEVAEDIKAQTEHYVKVSRQIDVLQREINFLHGEYADLKGKCDGLEASMELEDLDE